MKIMENFKNGVADGREEMKRLPVISVAQSHRFANLDAGGFPSRRPYTAWAFVLIACIGLISVVAQPPMPQGMRTVYDADPPEVRPGYFMNCCEPSCPNDVPIAPIHWYYVGGDTNRIDIKYSCTNCGVVFFVRKPTH